MQPTRPRPQAHPWLCPLLSLAVCICIQPPRQDLGVLPLSPLTGLGEVSTLGQGTWFPWQLPWQGWGEGLNNTDQQCRKGSIPGKSFDGKEQADQWGHRLSGQGPCSPPLLQRRVLRPAALCDDGTTLSLLFLPLCSARIPPSSLLSWDSTPNGGQL